MLGPLFALIVILLYAVWLFYPPYGWAPFFIGQILLVLSIISTHYGCRHITRSIRKRYPDLFPQEAYWQTLINYGVAIYYPRASESYAVSFSVARVIGWGAALLLIYLGRRLEALICFANTFLVGLIAGWLDPIFFMSKFARKKPNYAIKANLIQELREFVFFKLPTLY